MREQKGFTLIELLVVIAIIALLMGILLPSLSRSRKQAKGTVCQTYLKQWGIVFSMYTDDNNGYFPTRTSVSGRWIDVVYSYYKNGKFRCCPMATKIAAPQGSSNNLELGGGKYTAWGIVLPTAGRPAGTYGSYGINHWLYKPGQDPLYGQPAKGFWRNIFVKTPNQVPLFLDCWYWCGGPENDDRPPSYDGEKINSAVESMSRFCIDRHQGTINAIFMDYSVRKVGLKSLWYLKWSRIYDTNATLPEWPDWMRKFKDN